MSNLNPLFAAVLAPFAPPMMADADNEPSMFSDDREDIGYEKNRQRRIDAESDDEFLFELEEPTC